MLLHPVRPRPARPPRRPGPRVRGRGGGAPAARTVRGRRAWPRPYRRTRGAGAPAARGSGYRWERFADAAFYGAAASLAFLLVARRLTGAPGLLPEGAARPVLLTACAVVALAVTTAVATRR